MDGWMGVEWGGSFGRGSFDVTALSSTVDSATETSPRARFRNSRTPAGFTPKGWPSGLRTRGRFSTFEPAKSKERWMDGWMDGGGMGWKLWPWPWAALWSRLQKHLLRHGCETAEPQQDSGPRGGPLVCGPGAVSAPSNQLKAKRWMDGWMDGGGCGWMEWMDGGGMRWKLWPWIVWCNGPEQHRGFGYGNISEGTVPKQQNPSRIHAQGVAKWFADQGPFQHLRTS